MKSFRPPRSKLSALSLSASTFLIVSGGPYGLEELVQKTGYLGAVIILIVLPLTWALPTGLMVGELAAALPEEGGFYVWVRRAMGPFWGFQEAWLSLASSIFDMAAYPSLFLLSLGQLWPVALQDFNRLLMAATLILACVVWNLFGARAVGQGSIGSSALLLLPFAFLVVASILSAHRATSTLQALPLDWFGGILIAMWNYTGWDNASTVAQEVNNPQRTYPRVMMWTLVWTAVVYIVPVIAVWQAGIPAAAWSTGAWVSIAEMVGGRWLGAFVLIGTMVSVVGMMNSLTMSYSRIPLALAQDGYAPRALLRQLPNGAPWVAVLSCGLAWMLALGLSFDRILVLDIMLYGFSLILEFIALAILRVREPELARPFKIPGGMAGAVAVGIGPAALLIAALVANRHEQERGIGAVGIAGAFVGLGVLLYASHEWSARRNYRATKSQ
jgi:amino acid transporter